MNWFLTHHGCLVVAPLNDENIEAPYIAVGVYQNLLWEIHISIAVLLIVSIVKGSTCKSCNWYPLVHSKRCNSITAHTPVFGLISLWMVTIVICVKISMHTIYSIHVYEWLSLEIWCLSGTSNIQWLLHGPWQDTLCSAVTDHTISCWFFHAENSVTSFTSNAAVVPAKMPRNCYCLNAISISKLQLL